MGQVWRLLTNFLFFGHFGIDYLFHMYFLYVGTRARTARCVRCCAVHCGLCALFSVLECACMMMSMCA